MEPVELVGLLAEPARRRVFSALVLGAATPADVGAAAGLSPREVAVALRKLQASGLVDAALTVRAEAFTEAMRTAAPAPPPERDGDVVSRFVREGHLLSFPAQESKRRLVLEHVVQSFEPGRRYPERAVDAVLRTWTAGGATDHATLRRYLVDHQLLGREDGAYWRVGGPVVIDGADEENDSA